MLAGSAWTNGDVPDSMFQRGCRGRNFIAKYSLVIGFTDVGCCLYCPAKSRQVTLCTETRRGICVHDDIISADRLYMYAFHIGWEYRNWIWNSILDTPACQEGVSLAQQGSQPRTGGAQMANICLPPGTETCMTPPPAVVCACFRPAPPSPN